MRISIFGLGYVGAVTAGCLAGRGHSIVGVDISPQKVEDFNAGRASIIEPGLEVLLATASSQGRLRATAEAGDAIASTEISIVCVGTPSKVTGALDLTFVRQVTRQIATALEAKAGRHYLVFRSTMLPGSTQNLVIECLAPLLATGRVEIFYYPEFLREGTAIQDFESPSLVVVGTQSGTPPPAALEPLFGPNPSVTNWNTAELVKYACNAFHATKLAFANEIGRLGKQMHVDAQRVMALLCQDTRLNISTAYLRPGNPFGGSCLPKDVRALTDHGRRHGLSLPLIESLLPSNDRHLQSLLSLIQEADCKEVIILGLSFKSHTDDLRESPMVEVAQTLMGRGYKVRIYDPQLNLAALTGSNKRLIDIRMPHLASLLQGDLASALGTGGLIIAAQPCVEMSALQPLLTPQHKVLDLNGWPALRALTQSCEGFCW